LLDNDLVKQHLERVLNRDAGPSIERRFWELYEDVRTDLGAVSVPVTLERLRLESADAGMVDRLTSHLYAMPFAEFVYPGALELLRWLRGVGVPVILSDGDPWFQAKKITDAGLGAAVGGNVLIFLHKEKHVEDIRRWYPAERYVAVDDKAGLLGVLRRGFGDVLTTIWIQQGHYAETEGAEEANQPDFSVASVAELRPAIEQALAR
ncbi:MAG TPA: HAD family hydrolase, partial [Dehalococcoidia bacterium]|nr:HAD family hydrolase [Dehalococcoidia bacterium]